MMPTELPKRKMSDFFDGIEGENIEIGDGVQPDDVSEEKMLQSLNMFTL